MPCKISRRLKLSFLIHRINFLFSMSQGRNARTIKKNTIFFCSIIVLVFWNSIILLYNYFWGIRFPFNAMFCFLYQGWSFFVFLRRWDI